MPVSSLENTSHALRIQTAAPDLSDEDKKLDSIPRVNAAYHAQVVDDLKGEFLEGTRRRLFRELESWTGGRFPRDGPKQFYFLSGGAGLGKSSVAHQLCVRLDDSEQASRLAASFFFIRSEESLSSSRLFFSTLLHQLTLSQSILRPYIIAVVRDYLQRHDHQDMGSASRDLLRKAFRAASAASELAPLFLVVDGLDECKERRAVPDLLRSLLGLAREFRFLRIFAASRPEPYVMAVLTSPEVNSVVHHRSLDDTLDDWSSDVRLYLEKTIPKIASGSYTNFIHTHPDSLRRLVSRAAGVFIYARVAVNFLEEYSDHDPAEQFSLLLSPEGGAGLSPLDALYLQVLRSAFPPPDLRSAPLRRERLLSLLRVILLQHRPPMQPAQIALFGSGTSEMSAKDVVIMVDRLRSVLLINNTGEVTPLHATFGEFLLDSERCVDPLYHVDRAKGNACLALGCLAAFSITNVTEYLARPKGKVGEYVEHATVEWSAYCQDAGHNDELESRMRTFVQGDVQAIFQRARRQAVLSGKVVSNSSALAIQQMAQFLKVSDGLFPCIY